VKRNGSGQVVSGYDYGYGYDLMGNRTSETVAGVTTNSVFNDANQLTSRGGTTFAYDANGNLLSSSAGAAYSYNAKDQSSSIQRAGGTAQTQAYAGASQFERVEKADGGVTTQFGESLLGMLIRKEGSSTHYTRLPSGELLSQRTPSGSHYYLMDGLGTVVGMRDESGAVIARYGYDPYGQVLSESGPYNLNRSRFHAGCLV